MHYAILIALSPILLLGTYVPAAHGAEEPARFVRVTPAAAFSPRDTSEDAVFLGKMWLSNAYHEGNVLVRDLWNSGDGERWNLVSESTPYDGYSEMAVFKDRLWAVKESVWSSADGLEWRRELEKTPFGVRSYGELVVHDGRMWQLGSGEDIWSTTDGVEWQRAIEQAPYGDRWAAAVTVFDGRLWLIGGALRQQSEPPEKHYAAFTTCNDIWYSKDGATWERVLENAPWAPRMWFVAMPYKDRLWVIGGFDNRNSQNLADVWYSADGKTWTEFTPRPEFSPRHEPACYAYDESLWVVAGNSWPLVNDVWRLTLDTPPAP